MQLGKNYYSNNRTSFALDYSRNNFSEVANVFAALSSSQSNKSSRAIGNETVYISVRKRRIATNKIKHHSLSEIEYFSSDLQGR